MMIESTFIRHGKGCLRGGGLVGFASDQVQTQKIGLTFHNFVEVKTSLDRLTDETSQRALPKQKEEPQQR